MTDLNKQINNNAAWIGPGWKYSATAVNPMPMAFRKDYNLCGNISAAGFKIAAFYKYVLFINGKTVCYGPARSFPTHMFYDEIDIKPFLSEGDNSIAVVVFPTTNATAYAPVARMGLFVDGFVKTDTQYIEILTDKTWVYRCADWYNTGRYFVSMPTYYQEHFDQQAEPESWKTDKNLSWDKAFLLGNTGAPPFKKLSKRPISMLTEKSINPKCVWVGNAGREFITDGNPAVLFNKEKIVGEKFDNQAFCNEKYNVFTFDFLKTGFFRPGIQIYSDGKIKVELYYDILFNDRPTAMRGFGRDDEGFCDTFIPKEGGGFWEAAIPKGFRFLTVKICGSGNAEFELKCKSVDYPYGKINVPDTNDEEIIQIWNGAAESIKSCTNDVIVDTCSRENVLWTADACITAQAAYYTFGERAMWRRINLLIGEGIESDGTPKAVVPAEDSWMKLFDQTFTWVRSCGQYYELTGDDEFLYEVIPHVYDFMRLCSNHITEKGLFIPPDYSWYWVDWAKIDRRPYSLAINALLVIAADSGMKMAKAVSDGKLLELCENICNTVRNSAEAFFDEKENAFLGHIEPEKEYRYNSFGFCDPATLNPCCVHSNALAIRAKIGDEKMRKGAAGFIAKNLDGKPSDIMGPGWVYTILAPLFENGYEECAMKFIKKAFLAFINSGAPTFGECFDESAYNTAHGWGSCVNTLIYKYIGVK